MLLYIDDCTVLSYRIFQSINNFQQFQNKFNPEIGCCSLINSILTQFRQLDDISKLKSSSHTIKIPRVP
jgi:hypothetical protein